MYFTADGGKMKTNAWIAWTCGGYICTNSLEYTQHDLVALGNADLILYFKKKIPQVFRSPGSSGLLELHQRSTSTHDTVSPRWVVQNWSCQSRSRSLELIKPSRPWCDFFSLSRGEQADSLLDGWFHSPPAVCVSHTTIVTHVNVSCSHSSWSSLTSPTYLYKNHQ